MQDLTLYCYEHNMPENATLFQPTSGLRVGINKDIFWTTTDAKKPATSLGTQKLAHLLIFKSDRGFESTNNKPQTSIPTINVSKAKAIRSAILNLGFLIFLVSEFLALPA